MYPAHNKSRDQVTTSDTSVGLDRPREIKKKKKAKNICMFVVFIYFNISLVK